MDVEAQIADLTRRVSVLETAAKGQERHNVRVTELLTELKEDVALSRLACHLHRPEGRGDGQPAERG